MKKWLVLALILVSVPLFAMGERPNTKATAKKSISSTSQAASQPGNSTQNSASQDAAQSISSVTGNAKQATQNVVQPLTDDVLFDLEKNYEDLIKQKQFNEALALLVKVPDSQLTRRRKIEKGLLYTFVAVEDEVSKTNTLFQKDDELDEATKKTVQKLYKEAQLALIQGKNDLSRDLLIHILNLHRRSLRAKKLLELGLDLKVGSYKIENMETKYWDKSKVYFYGGNYGASIDALTVLLFFDNENPLVYERLGSSYYMSGEKKKAIEAWNTALYFDPTNKDLAQIVEKTKQVMKEDETENKALEQNRKKTTTTQATPVESQVFGIYKTQNEAYNYASELKKQGLNPIVEETDNGKWAVKVPKSQLEKKK